MAVIKKGVYWHMFPQQNQAYKIVCLGLDDNKNKWTDIIPPELVAKYPTRNDANIYFKNGSIVMLLGIDKVKASNRGAGADGVVISEYAFSEYEDTTSVIEPILKASGGFLIINSTPNGHNQFYDIVKVAHKMPDKWLVDERNVLDTKLLDWDTDIQPDIDSGRDSLDNAMKEYMCSFGELSTGSIYGNEIQRAKDEGRVGPYDHDPEKLVDTYWDIGIEDYTAVWFCQNVGSRRVLIDYYEDNQKPPSEYVKMLKDKGYRYNRHYLPHDAKHTKPSTYELLTTQGMYDRLLKDFNVSGKTYACDKPHRKIVSINNLRAIFHTLYFSDKVKKALNNVEKVRFKFNAKAKVFSAEPQKSPYLHGTDALTLIGVASAMKNKEYFLDAPERRKARKVKSGLSIKW